MTKEKQLVLLWIMGVILVILIPLSIWIMKSHFEAQAFNAVTGKNVSTWQAMWIQLRVQETADYEKEKK